MTSDGLIVVADGVDLNVADSAELRAGLPGVGPVLAERIVAYRHEHGPFQAADHLARVPGISARLAKTLLGRVRVAPAAALDASRTDDAGSASPFESSLGAAFDAPDARAALDSIDAAAATDTTAGARASEPELRAFLATSQPTIVAANEAPYVALATPAHESIPPNDSIRPSVEIEPVVVPSDAAPATTARDPRVRRGYAMMAVVTLLAVLTGTSGGAWMSERKAGAATASVDTQVHSLRAEERSTEDELKRQGALIAATQGRLDEALSIQRGAEERAEARSARIAKDVSELADRTRQAQARSDARVVKLDEALKLIDWVTTSGYAHQIAATPHAGPSVSPSLATP
jgi:competence ComEA-like helix-hairpin-helix protein